MNNTLRGGLGLAVFVLICFAAAGIGSMLTAPHIGGWYATLRKPSWTPPNWVFGPVWSTLYFMMAIAAWLVWRKHGFSGAPFALTLFAVQLALNVTWSGLFFALQRPGAAFAEIVLLWCAIAATTISFWRLSPTAGWLMSPYWVWVTYAAALNLTIWRLNL
jgi:tryptophan-rich sensory protein